MTPAGTCERGRHVLGQLAAEVAQRAGDSGGPPGAVDPFRRPEVGHLQLGRPAGLGGHFDRLDPRVGPRGGRHLEAEQDDLVAPVLQPAGGDVVGVQLAVRPQRKRDALPAELAAGNAEQPAAARAIGGHAHAHKGMFGGADRQRRAEHDRPLRVPVHVARRLPLLAESPSRFQAFAAELAGAGLLGNPDPLNVELAGIGRIEPQADDLLGRVPERPDAVDVELAVALGVEQAMLLRS